MTPLSIGVFTYSTKPRGSVAHAAALTEALTARGHNATLYALHKDGEGFYRPLRARLVLVPALPAPSATDALIAQRIAELSNFLKVRAPRHDVCHAEDCLVANGLVGARAHSTIPALVRTMHHVERFDSAYLNDCQTRSVFQADCLISVSRATRDDVKRTFGVSTRVIENGVDVARFSARDPALVKRVSRRLGLDGPGPVILSIGGVEQRKNTLNMLEAFLAVHRAHPSARWVIAGGASIFDHSPYVAAFRERLARCPESVRSSVQLVGVVPDEELVSLVQLADALMHVSRHEGFGLCVLEALAAGTPAIVSAGPPFTEYLDHRSALLVDSESPTAIARAVQAVLRDRNKTIAAGRAVADRYSWATAARAHEDIYRSLLGPPGAPPIATTKPQQQFTLGD